MVRHEIACADAKPVTWSLQANDPPPQLRRGLQAAGVGEPPFSISPATHPDLQRQASTPARAATQPLPSPSLTSRAIRWVGLLPPWRGPMEVLTAQEGHDLVVPRRLTGDFDPDVTPCRLVTLLIPTTRASPERYCALRLMLRGEPETPGLDLRRFGIPADDVHELLRLSSKRDGLGRLHIRITARCTPYTRPALPHDSDTSTLL